MRLLPLFLLAALVLGGCQRTRHGGDANDPVARPWEPLAIAPPDSLVVVRVDVEAIQRRQRFLALVQTLVGRGFAGERASSARDVAIAIVASTREAVLAFPRVEIPVPPALLVLRGQFPSNAASLLADTLSLERTRRGPITVYTSELAAIAQLGGHTLLSGTRETVMSALDRMLAEPPPDVPLEGHLAELADRTSLVRDALGLVVALRPSAFASLGIDLPDDLVDHIRGLRAHVDVENGLEVHMTVLTDRPLAARRFVAIATEKLEAARSAPALRALGLADLLDAVTMEPDGSEVAILYQLPPGRAELLVQQLEAVVDAFR